MVGPEHIKKYTDCVEFHKTFAPQTAGPVLLYRSLELAGKGGRGFGGKRGRDGADR